MQGLIVDMSIAGVEFKSMPSGLHNVTDDLVYPDFSLELTGE